MSDDIRKGKPSVLCTWCDQQAVAAGTDGTFSCGQGQGDGLEPHDNEGIEYKALGSGFGWQRLKPGPKCPDCGFHHPTSSGCMTPYRLEDR